MGNGAKQKKCSKIGLPYVPAASSHPSVPDRMLCYVMLRDFVECVAAPTTGLPSAGPQK